MIGKRNFTICLGPLVVLAASFFSVSGQPLERGWRGLLPLVSTKENVEKILGKPERVDDNGYYFYEIDRYYVQVNYSTEPCQPNQYNRGKFNVAKNTVLDTWINVKKQLLLTELDFDRSQFYKDTGGDLLNVYYYYSRGTGIRISVGIQDEKRTEYVGKITYEPSQKLQRQFACSEHS